MPKPLHGPGPGGSRKAAVPFILVCVLLDVLGFGLVIPVLPALVGEFTVARDAQAYWYGVMSVVVRRHAASLARRCSARCRTATVAGR